MLELLLAVLFAIAAFTLGRRHAGQEIAILPPTPEPRTTHEEDEEAHYVEEQDAIEDALTANPDADPSRVNALMDAADAER